MRDGYYYIRNRFFRKYYMLDIKAMDRHQWYDADYQLFHAMFQILVNYVEEELGRGEIGMMDWYKKELKKGEKVHPTVRAYMKASLWDRWKNRQTWKERMGKVHLDWAAGLERYPGVEWNQADVAVEVLKLYNWYKHERPKRPDPWDIVEKPECILVGRAKTHIDVDGESIINPHHTDEDKAEVNRYHNEVHGLEQDYDDEDTSRAQQLLAIRFFMWT